MSSKNSGYDLGELVNRKQPVQIRAEEWRDHRVMTLDSIQIRE